MVLLEGSRKSVCREHARTGITETQDRRNTDSSIICVTSSRQGPRGDSLTALYGDANFVVATAADARIFSLACKLRQGREKVGRAHGKTILQLFCHPIDASPSQAIDTRIIPESTKSIFWTSGVGEHTSGLYSKRCPLLF